MNCNASGAAFSVLNKLTRLGATGTRILNPTRSAAVRIGLLLVVIWRNPRSHIFSIGTRPAFAVICWRTKAPRSPSIAGHSLS